MTTTVAWLLPTDADLPHARRMGWTGRAIGALWLILMLAGCRTLGGSPSLPSPAAQASPQSAPTSGPAGSAAEAPSECGFPSGTPLEFSGRTTTAALDVQEVVGDPMSTQLADIYITREAFDQGELHGRLVCAVFVDEPAFVEITVHPDDGGRPVPPTPFASVPAPSGGISKLTASDVALAHVGDAGAWQLMVVESGPIGRVLPDVLEDSHVEWAIDLSPDLWVWRVFLVRGDEGVDVIIDYADGTVLGTASYIVN
jgi:hypothetical protein